MRRARVPSDQENAIKKLGLFLADSQRAVQPTDGDLDCLLALGGLKLNKVDFWRIAFPDVLQKSDEDLRRMHKRALLAWHRDKAGSTPLNEKISRILVGLKSATEEELSFSLPRARRHTCIYR